jgi:toxin-antitoxin system PIN domain toxin
VRIVDLNVLLYAINVDSVHHAAARAWWEGALNGDELVGLPWIVLVGFLRLATNPIVFPRPLAPETAVARIDAWLARENVRIVREKDNHWDALKPLLAGAGTAGNLVNDADLAALAMSHGATLVTCDADFARFMGLRRENPIA